MRATRTTALLGVLLAGAVVAAPVAEAAPVKTVSMTSSLTFSPKTATVTRGTVVVWRNTSFTTHTSTSDQGLWKARVAPGASFRRTFGKVGTFRYHCAFHSRMTGVVVVRTP